MIELALSLQGFQIFHYSFDGNLGINSGAFKEVEALFAVQSVEDCVDAAAEVGGARVDDVKFRSASSTLINKSGCQYK